ncbi:ABC transporter permease [Nonomuraea sp. NPDC050783]|uniref:ABC transporter permease n=1 Tax=Nonomuraea sp. NPDC050783 TaxID=3154634 RepID=UPI003467D78C
MRRYLITRLAQAAGVLWAAYTIAFFILDYLPGDPVSVMAGAAAQSAALDPAQLEALRREYGFDRPVLARYAAQLTDALRGDLGDSMAAGRPVTSVIAQALPPTLQLTGSALLLAVAGGGGLALLATATRRRWLRQVLLSLPSLAVSVPAFWIGLMLVQLLSFRVRIFPAFGDDGPAGLVLPAVTLAVPTAALLAQVLARSLTAALAEPYVQTARAKGAGRARVHLRHALRNACLPALTVAGLLAGQLLAGAVVIETVFSRDGLGRITASAVAQQDIPVVQGVVVVGAMVFVLVNLAIDLLFPLLDKRVAIGTAHAGSAA